MSQNLLTLTVHKLFTPIYFHTKLQILLAPEYVQNTSFLPLMHCINPKGTISEAAASEEGFTFLKERYRHASLNSLKFSPLLHRHSIRLLRSQISLFLSLPPHYYSSFRFNVIYFQGPHP